MGFSGSRTPRASHSVSGYRFRLLGDGFKIKSVTPYHSQSERGTQPWGGAKFSASPWEGEREVLGSPGLGGKIWNFFFPSRGEGEVSSRVELEKGGWFRPLPGGTRQAREEGGP